MTDSQDRELPTKFEWKECSSCHERFQAYVAMEFCPRCRMERLAMGSTPDYDLLKRAYWDYQHHQKASNEWHEMVGDWRVIDEHGVEVWARDLAERYRSELRRRRTGDFQTQRSRSSSR